MKYIAFILLIAILNGINSLPDARSKCRSIYHVDADPASRYTNDGCQLMCYIHGQVNLHDVNEGGRCPLSSGSCRKGECISRTKLGFIDLEIISAQLSKPANAYVTTCSQNSSAPIPLPIKNRGACVSCTSNLSPFTATPVWNSVCANSGQRVFLPDARVIAEVWESKGNGANNKIFLGGVSLTIPQLLSHGDNHKKLSLSLTGGQAHGMLTFRVTWTPKE